MTKLSAKAQRIYEAGCAAGPEARGPLLAAIAAMIDESTKKSPPKKKTTKSSADRLFGERVWTHLQETVPDAILFFPKQPQTYSTLGKKLRDAEITAEDIEVLAQWIKGGGLSWMDRTPKWTTFIKWSLDWIAEAKQSKSTQTKLQFLEDQGALAKLRDDGDL